MKKFLSVLSLCLIVLRPSGAGAELTIEITQGMEGAVPIAIVPFGGLGAGVPEDVSQIVADDLRRSGRFEPVPERNLIARPVRPEDIRFADWKTLGVESLVIGEVQQTGAGQYNIRFFLFDVYRGAKLIGFSVPTTTKRLRFDSHRVADLIYEKLTGIPGAFATRIAYVTELSRGGEKDYRLEIADSDGHNPHTVLNSKDPLMSPSWSADGTQLAYVSFEKRRASIWVQNVATAKRRKIASFDGINGAPAWSPDGSRLALTLSRDGNPEVYAYEMSSGALKRLTRSAAIDTEPTWSPDGRSIAFTSDRGGSPQIYEMPATGGRTRRMTFEGNYNASPDYSPDGKQMAMVHGEGGAYQIAVLDIDSDQLQVLSDGRLDESPSFAPNGSMIIYASESAGRGVLAAVSSDGRFRQRLSASRGSVREPVWSPFENRR
jgi:TolB protein